jgi:hypothetical protein
MSYTPTFFKVCYDDRETLIIFQTGISMVGFSWQSCSDIAVVTYRVVLQFSCAVTRYRRELQGGQVGKFIFYKLAC